MIWKRCTSCGKRIQEGTRCSCGVDAQRKRHKEYDTTRRNQTSKRFYNSAEWQKARNRAIAECGGIDIYTYMTEGKIVAADTVHHITPLTEDWNLRTNQDNLLPISAGGHAALEARARQYGACSDGMSDDSEKFRAELRKMKREFRERLREGGV